MARLPYCEPDHASPEVATLLGHLPDLHLFRMIGHAETAVGPWLRLGGTLLSELTLDPVLRELAILQVAASTGADYERVQHEAIAIELGVTTDMVDAIARHQLDSPALTAHARVLRSVDRLVRGHGATAAEFEQLRVGLDDRQLVELLLVVGYYLGLAVLINAVDLDPDPLARLPVPGRVAGEVS
jgi:alkylhydroperoxidase family enzyme